MSIHNVVALLIMYSHRNVAAVRTQAGIIFMGMRNISPSERKMLLEIPQAELDAALRWQK